MEKEGNSFNSENASVTNAGQEAKFLNIGLKTWATIIVPILAALITATAGIITAIISIRSNQAPPAFTSTVISSPTYFMTDSLTPTFTSTLFPTTTPSPTSTITTTITPSQTMTLLPQPKLIVLLQANKTSGKAPLKVKLDARESYLTDYDGQKYVCRNGACYYIWKVYSNGQQVGKSVTDSGGTFDYTFGRQGTYMVTVWICRGQDKIDCGGSGAQIVATR